MRMCVCVCVCMCVCVCVCVYACEYKNSVIKCVKCVFYNFKITSPKWLKLINFSINIALILVILYINVIEIINYIQIIPNNKFRIIYIIKYKMVNIGSQ